MRSRNTSRKNHKPGKVFLESSTVSTSRLGGAAVRPHRQGGGPAKQVPSEGTIEKVYWAVVEGEVQRSAGSLEDWLLKDRDEGRVEVVEPAHAAAGPVALPTAGRPRRTTSPEVRPQTGRTHQPGQPAHDGYPIYGDAKYGSVHTFGAQIGLTSPSRSRSASRPVRANHFDRPVSWLAWPSGVPAARGHECRSTGPTPFGDIIQEDVNRRGLATVPGANLLTACADDFGAACRSIADEPEASVAVVTGFFIRMELRP